MTVDHAALLKGGYIRGAEAEGNTIIGGTGRDPFGFPCPSNTPLATGDEDRGMADGEDVDIKQDGTGCEGMAICPLPTIWHRAPIPTQIMTWLQRRFLHLSFPQM